jgi:hypothetical protein
MFTHLLSGDVNSEDEFFTSMELLRRCIFHISGAPPEM